MRKWLCLLLCLALGLPLAGAAAPLAEPGLYPQKFLTDAIVDMGREIDAFFSRADAFLLGRRTYDIFASYWPNVTDPNDPVAGPLNARPKFVASRTRDAFDWNNTAPIRDVVGEVPGLKQRFGREVQVHGSSDLAQTLIANNLIDEYRLYVFPVILGMGKRLFGAGAIPAALRLVRSITTSTGVVISVYRPAGAVQTGEV